MRRVYFLLAMYLHQCVMLKLFKPVERYHQTFMSWSRDMLSGEPFFCSRCDARDHNEEDCPLYRTERESYRDAWSHFANPPTLEADDRSN